MKLAIIGPGRCGKDTAAEFFADRTLLRYWGSCSQVILPEAAKRLGVSEEQAWAERHEKREFWRALGDEMRKDDPAALARVTLERGDLCVGVRSHVEMRAVIDQGLVDLVVWIHRPGIPNDPTLEFGRGLADVFVENDGTLADFRRKLKKFAATLGVFNVAPVRSESRVLYISGPMSGKPGYNFADFDRTAMRLRAAGYRVLNPADFGADPRHTWGDCLARDLFILGQASGVATLDGWGQSRGATLEIEFAQKAGIPIRPAAEWLATLEPHLDL